MAQEIAAIVGIMAMFFFSPVSVFAATMHTAEQEQMEQTESQGGSETQAHAQIEATEESVLGHDAHAKLEVLHAATESHPYVAGGVATVAVGGAIAGATFFLKRKKL